MNKRLEELMREAGYAEPELAGRAIKLSELIVKECLDNMENCDGDVDFAIWKTQKDFGVE